MPELTPPAGAAPVWQLNPLVDLHWRIWGSSCVAFEAVSGETSVLDALEAAALACFEEGPMDLAGLVRALAADLGQAPHDALVERVSAIVQECLARGWLERLESSR